MSSSTSGQDLVLHESTMVRAGAGAGKTTALIQRFVDYALKFRSQHKRWPRIVLTTFTKKATHEIKERLFQSALDKEDIELFSYINSPSQVQITTIHGLLSSFLMENGLEMGLRPQVTVGDQRLLNQEKRNLLRRLMLENPQWSQILEVWRFSELLEILDEWSSKHLQTQDFRPWPKDKMRDEVKEILLAKARGLERTLLEIRDCTENTSWTEWASGFPRDLQNSSLDELVDRLRNWRKQRARRPNYSESKPPFAAGLKDRVVNQVDDVDELVGLKIMSSEFQEQLDELHSIFDPLAQEFSKQFFTIRLQKGLLSFDDLEVFSYRMMQEHPEYIRQFSKNWDYWLIDEYQDTSPLQVELLRELIGAAPHYVVGDPQQSIYLFRGARVEVFEAKMQELEQKRQKIIKQLTNYRSRKEILEFINCYFSYFNNNFAAMEVGSKDSNPNEPALDVIPVLENEEEALRAKDYIIHLLQKGVSPEAICVLSATHLSLSRLGEALNSAKVDFQIHSQGKFFERDEVIDAITILKFLSNPHDNTNFVGLLRSPWFHLPTNQIQDFCKPGSYWLHALKSSWAQEEVLQELQSYLLRMKATGVVDTFKNILLEKGLFQSAGPLDGSGLREANLWKLILHLMAAEKKSGFSLTEYIRRIEENQSLVEGELEGDAAPFEEPRKVQLMTIHASKGLQYSHILLLGYGRDQQKTRTQVWAHSDGYYSLSLRDEETGEQVPSWMAYKIKNDLNLREEEEFLRLLYVAFTRAKNKIAIFEMAKTRKSSWQGLFKGSWSEINSTAQRKGLSPLVAIQTELPAVDIAPAGVAAQKAAMLTPFQANATTVPTAASSVTAQLASAAKVKSWSAESFRKIQKGVDFHRIVEVLKYESADQTAATTESLDVDFKKALTFVREYKDIPLLQLIQNGQVEWGFVIKQTTNEAAQITRGQIDLWCYYEETLWVVDYKTGRSGDGTETAFQQVSSYAEALYKIYPDYRKQTTKLVIIYPFEEKIEVRIKKEGVL